MRSVHICDYCDREFTSYTDCDEHEVECKLNPRSPFYGMDEEEREEKKLEMKRLEEWKECWR